MTVELRKLSYALGAEVCGVDTGKPMSEAFFGEIYQAFLDHGILLFRDQIVTREQHIDFSRRFGELDRHDALPRDRHPDYPEILLVTNEPKPDGSPSDSRYTGRQWHSDMSFTQVPSLGSLSLRIHLPPPVARERHHRVGQPLHDASRAGRLRRNAAQAHGAHDGAGDAVGLCGR